MEMHDGRDAGTVPLDDPWYDVIASDWGESVGAGTRSQHPSAGRDPARAVSGPPPAPTPAPERAPAAASTPAATAAEVYLEVQRSAAFQQVRSRYRRFVLPASASFLAWYLAYVITATTAPGLMARPVAGPLNIGMLAGLGQFASTFLLTWAYARHARLRRDRAALDLRWQTQELTRERIR